MSDDLVRRLRQYGALEVAVSGKPWTLGEESADRIESDAALIKRLRAALRSLYIWNGEWKGLSGCGLCYREWPIGGSEAHADGCLAAPGDE